MAEIKFDPELILHLKTIYGDAELSDKTLRLLYNTWKVNPEYIRSTALQKARLSAPLTRAGVAVLSTPLLTTINPVNEITNDDLSGISDFNTAFREANKRGLKVFKWRGTKVNPSGLFGTQYTKSNSQTSSNSKENVDKGITSGRKVSSNTNNKKSVSKGTVETGIPVLNNPRVLFENNLAVVALDVVDNNGDVTNRNVTRWTHTPLTVNMWGLPLSEELIELSKLRNNGWTLVSSKEIPFKQQGGTMNNQEELQKAFMAYLIQDAAAQGIQLLSEQDLLAYAQLLGEEGIQAKYQEFMQRMQGGVKARLGAKLEYYRKLKGVCPDGSQPTYFKKGGFFKKECSACQKAKKGTEINPVQEFKNKRKHINENDTIHADNKVYDLTGKHKQYPKLTNDKYRKLSDRKQSDVDLKDQARKNACGAKMKKK